jgi:molybdopterin-guanine dinucleotide biosynthesis protein A
MSNEISGFVLAGGRSSRLGLDKVLLPWNGQTLLGHAVERLQQVCGTVRVCADRDDLPAHQPPIHDALPGAGPLSAIVAALEQSQTPWNLFLAVDLPLVPVDLLKALAARTNHNHAGGAGMLSIIPQVEGLPQPLCGLYHCSLAPGLHRALEQGKYKIMLALQEAAASVERASVKSRVEFFDLRNFAAADVTPGLEASEWLLNINTPQDWQLAQELARLR